MTPPAVAPPPPPTIQGPCAWCTPKDTLDALNLKYPGQISHTLCPSCAETLLKETA